MEVADTSASYDRELKLPLYARSAIPEIWLVDLNTGIVEVYTRPENGEYRESRRASRDDSLTASAIPDFSIIEVGDILG
ncbi:hypothetical protein BH24ACT21_BH24ACT21_11630 [soil metagenome]